jgi:sugar lactone lactonase YvrE
MTHEDVGNSPQPSGQQPLQPGATPPRDHSGEVRAHYPHRNPFMPASSTARNDEPAAPIAPIGWHPPKAPARHGLLAPNDALRTADLLAAGDVRGPEDLALDREGRLYFGSFGDGRILRTTGPAERTASYEVFTHTGGAPVDLTFTPDGTLLVCDWERGILKVAPDGTITTVLEPGMPIDGLPFVRPDGIARRNDVLYLSEGSRRRGEWNGTREVLEAGCYGRVVAYDPRSQTGWTVFAGLSFANGLALAPDESHLRVADQYRYRVMRHWLFGPRVGDTEVFVDNLPGFPHNLHFDEDGLLWVGLYQGRDALVDWLAPHPQLKRLVAHLPERLLSGPEHPRPTARGKGSVLALDRTGTIVHSLANPPARVNTVSAALHHRGVLYVGTLTGDAVLRLRLKGTAKPNHPP